MAGFTRRDGTKLRLIFNNWRAQKSANLNNGLLIKLRVVLIRKAAANSEGWKNEKSGVCKGAQMFPLSWVNIICISLIFHTLKLNVGK